VKKANPAPFIHTILDIRRDSKGKIWSHIRQKWLVETPEERVRQEYVCALVNEYEYTTEQMAEEMSPPGVRGTANARADIVVWRSIPDRVDGENPLIVVECKADNVTIDQATYTQGGNYANFCKARFFVTHNHRQTKYWKVDHSKLAPNYAEIKDIPHAGASEKEINEILASLRTFREDEFADLLHQCHNVIRNREHLDPAAAFDEIAKILFVKVWSERRMRERGERKNLFTVDVLNQQLSKDPINSLFDQTKDTYRSDKIFAANERIKLRPATVEDIVKRLQAYNLSDTSEDVKGIAFERFLGRTFRGEIGQFFTPRSIVEGG
jgi:type I restriction enzyme M protein